jgi:hypothetical protein
MVERSESEKRRPDGEARTEPTRRVTVRAGASQRAIDAGRGGDMMRNPSRPPECARVACRATRCRPADGATQLGTDSGGAGWNIQLHSRSSR